MTTDFWANFKAKYWDREPGVFRGLDGVISAQEAWEISVRLADAARGQESSPVFRAYINDVLVAGRAAGIHSENAFLLPQEQDGSFAGFYSRIQQQVGNAAFGIIGNDVERFVAPATWSKLRRFIQSLYTSVGLPKFEAGCDLFFGRYPTTPFGVHTDIAHVFTWVIEGTKRFRMWPGDYPEKNGVSLQSRVDYLEFVEDAVTIEAGPGDLVYWPASHWHTAENDDLCTTITFMWRTADFRTRLPGGNCFTTVLDAAKKLSHLQSNSLEQKANSITQLAAAASSDQLDEELWASWLTRVSALSFAHLPSLHPVTYDKGGRFISSSDVDLHWVNLGERYLCAANGHTFDVPLDATAALHLVVGSRDWDFSELARLSTSVSIATDLLESCMQLGCVEQA